MIVCHSNAGTTISQRMQDANICNESSFFFFFFPYTNALETQINLLAV